MSMLCPLCSSRNFSPFYCDKRREYYRCSQCFLVFVPPSYYLSAGQERAEYELHNNNVNDEGYRNFLSRVFNPLVNVIKPQQCGLDFGCGPGPALQLMLQGQGFSVAVFDIFYNNNVSVFNNQYDFITATEVIEHLHNPMFELQRLWSCLAPNGYLALMTKLVVDDEAFRIWHYKNDLTHVCFYSKETFIWLSELFNARLEFIDKDVIFLQKITHEKA